VYAKSEPAWAGPGSGYGLPGIGPSGIGPSGIGPSGIEPSGIGLDGFADLADAVYAWGRQEMSAAPAFRSTVTSGRGRSGTRGTATPAAEPTPDLSDVEALVARAQAGDAEAFGDIYDRYVDVIYRYVYYRVGSSQLAEDLVSETFLRALRRIGSFTWQGKDVAAWLITIARNLIVDHYKSSRYKLELSTADLLGSHGDRASGDAGPEAEALASMTNATLIEALKSLGAEQQECLVLRFLQGLSLAETALAMGKKEGAIKALQYRAVRSLARELPEGFAP
jgi:RNA polymerase sigma-70 factor (ECF subfamily)